MRRLTLAVVLLTGCGGSDRPPPSGPSPLEQAIAGYQRVGFFAGERPVAVADPVSRA